MRRTTSKALAAVGLAVMLVVPTSASPAAAARKNTSPAATARTNNNPKKLLDAVTAAAIMRHEQAFQGIADANGGTRASGTPGYDASAQYVYDQLVAAGYSPVFQEFQFPFFEELSPGSSSRSRPTPSPTRPTPSPTRGRGT